METSEKMLETEWGGMLIGAWVEKLVSALVVMLENDK